MNSSKGFISLTLASFLYATWGVLSRILGVSFPFFFQLWTRYALVCGVVLVILLFSNGWKSIRVKDYKWFLLRSIAGILSISTIYIAFNNITIGTAYLLSYVGLIGGGFVIGKVLFHEKFTKLKFLSLGLALLGLVFIFSFNFSGGKIIFMSIAAVNGIVYSLWNSISKKVSNYSVSQVVFVDYFIAFLITLCCSLLVKEQFQAPTIDKGWIAQGIFAISMLLSSQLIAYGFRYIEVQWGNILMLSEILFAVVLAYLFFNESLSIQIIIGGVAIVCAMLIPNVIQRK